MLRNNNSTAKQSNSQAFYADLTPTTAQPVILSNNALNMTAQANNSTFQKEPYSANANMNSTTS